MTLDAAITKFSPINYVSAVKASVWMFQGTLDTRTPPGQAESYASALRGSHPNGIGYGALGLSGRVITADRDSNQADLLAWTPQGLSSTA